MKLKELFESGPKGDKWADWKRSKWWPEEIDPGSSGGRIAFDKMYQDAFFKSFPEVITIYEHDQQGLGVSGNTLFDTDSEWDDNFDDGNYEEARLESLYAQLSAWGEFFSDLWEAIKKLNQQLKDFASVYDRINRDDPNKDLEKIRKSLNAKFKKIRPINFRIVGVDCAFDFHYDKSDYEFQPYHYLSSYGQADNTLPLLMPNNNYGSKLVKCWDRYSGWDPIEKMLLCAWTHGQSLEGPGILLFEGNPPKIKLGKARELTDEEFEDLMKED